MIVFQTTSPEVVGMPLVHPNHCFYSQLRVVQVMRTAVRERRVHAASGHAVKLVKGKRRKMSYRVPKNQIPSHPRPSIPTTNNLRSVLWPKDPDLPDLDPSLR